MIQERDKEVLFIHRIRAECCRKREYGDCVCAGLRCINCIIRNSENGCIFNDEYLVISRFNIKNISDKLKRNDNSKK